MYTCMYTLPARPIATSKKKEEKKQLSVYKIAVKAGSIRSLLITIHNIGSAFFMIILELPDES